MRRLRGFTLLELVVVTAIIAIVLAMVVPQLSAGGRWRDLNREADSLAARIRVAQDVAMLEGREFGIAFTEDGYRFVWWDAAASRFRAVRDPAARWAQKQFDEGLSIAVAGDAPEALLELPEPESGEKPPEGKPADDEPAWAPAVFVLSSGEVTPFTALFRAEGEEDEVRLRIDPLGNRLPEDDDAP